MEGEPRIRRGRERWLVTGVSDGRATDGRGNVVSGEWRFNGSVVSGERRFDGSVVSGEMRFDGSFVSGERRL